MSLTQSSLWTTRNGLTVRVRDMSIAEIASAILYIEDLQLQERDNDPYVVATFCVYSDYCDVQPEPKHEINKVTLDDWYVFFNNELSRRSDIIEKRLFRRKTRVQKRTIIQRLVNALKFW